MSQRPSGRTTGSSLRRICQGLRVRMLVVAASRSSEDVSRELQAIRQSFSFKNTRTMIEFSCFAILISLFYTFDHLFLINLTLSGSSPTLKLSSVQASLGDPTQQQRYNDTNNGLTSRWATTLLPRQSSLMIHPA